MTRTSTRRLTVGATAAVLGLLAVASAPAALARLVERDVAVDRPVTAGSPARVVTDAAARTTAARTTAARTAAADRAAAAAGLACELVRGLRVCTHGDDAHLADSTNARGPAGSASSTSSTRIGCYRSGPRVQTVYARPVTGQDRYSASLPSFRGWAGAVEKTVDSSARKTNGARHVRFVTTPSGSSCALSVLNVALPPQAFASFSATISALQERGLDEPGVKYLVWADARGYCGIATAYQDDKPGQDNLNNGAFPSYARIDKACWGRAEAHELMHMLGAVQAGAPHATAGQHCRDGADVMCYDDRTAGSKQQAVCPASHAALLDCRSDDYFSTNPPAGSWLAQHWNTAHSAFLARGWTDPAPASAPPASPAATPAPSPAAEPAPSPEPTRRPNPHPLLPAPLPTLLAGLS